MSVTLWIALYLAIGFLLIFRLLHQCEQHGIDPFEGSTAPRWVLFAA